MKRKLLVLSCIMAVLVSANAKTVRGSGKIVSKTIDVSSFTGVLLLSSADIEVSKGNSFSVVLSDYENLISYHELVVENNQLKVSTKEHISMNNSKAKVKITLPGAFYSVCIKGSGDVKLKNINTINELSIMGSGDIVSLTPENYGDIKLMITGSGDIRLLGTAQNSTVKLSGSGDVNLTKLASQHANCTLGGSGDIKVWAEQTLDATLTGSGDMIYFGNPKVEKHVVGSGSMIHK